MRDYLFESRFFRVHRPRGIHGVVEGIKYDRPADLHVFHRTRDVSWATIDVITPGDISGKPTDRRRPSSICFSTMR